MPVFTLEYKVPWSVKTAENQLEEIQGMAGLDSSQEA